MADEDFGGIDRAAGHPRALQLVPDEFFWNCADELAPFGSDEGDTALNEYRDWRKENPGEGLEACLTWTIECVGEIDAAEYTDAIFEEATVRSQLADPDYDDEQLIYVTDVSVIATAFGQLADEGRIDAAAKPYALRALKRQMVWARLQQDWPHAQAYLGNLDRLQAILAEA
jgi:uncharacterized protein YfeS